VSSRSVPTSFEGDWNLNFGDRNYGKLSWAAGPEPIWGNDWSVYAKYTYRIKSWLPTVLFRYENIKWGLPNEYRLSAAVTSKFYGFRSVPLEGGILFQPFRVNHQYVMTHPSTADNAYGNSGYYISTNTTSMLDAFGFIIKGSSDLSPVVNKLTLTYTYRGRIAGNINKFDLELEKKVNPCYFLYWQNIYQQPVEPAETLIFEGTGPLSPGPPYTMPRGRDGAFWVNSQNRQAVLSSLFFVYDPTPGQWIYKYYPNLLELWNLNTAKKTPFSFIFNYKLTYYPGTTDLEFYKNSADEFIWPGEFDSTTVNRLPNPLPAGAWPMNRPIHLFTMMGEFSVFDTGMLIIMIKAGEDIATAAIAYTPHTYELLPVTKIFNPMISFVKYPFQVTLEYGHNIWGDEQWYKDLGATVDDFYRVAFKFNINKNHELEVSYVGTRETDGQYFVPKLAPYDEFQLTYRGKFTGRLDLSGLFTRNAKPGVDKDLEMDLLGGGTSKDKTKTNK
jgi:hypothetical protein